jgi:hypothetical protein
VSRFGYGIEVPRLFAFPGSGETLRSLLKEKINHPSDKERSADLV